MFLTSKRISPIKTLASLRTFASGAVCPVGSVPMQEHRGCAPALPKSLLAGQQITLWHRTAGGREAGNMLTHEIGQGGSDRMITSSLGCHSCLQLPESTNWLFACEPGPSLGPGRLSRSLALLEQGFLVSQERVPSL